MDNSSNDTNITNDTTLDSLECEMCKVDDELLAFAKCRRFYCEDLWPDFLKREIP